MTFPTNVLNRLNILDVNTDSNPIRAINNYSTGGGVTLFTGGQQQTNSIFNTVSDGVSSNFTDAGVTRLNNTPGVIDILNFRPQVNFPQRLPDLQIVPFEPNFGRGIYIPGPPPQVIIPKTPIYNIAGVKKLDLTEHYYFSANFARNKPRILFVMDYIIDGEKIGNLIVFEKYQTSTHYEIFKKNLFTEINDFQRILFLDAPSLSQETTEYKTYIREHVGLDSLADGSYYVVMDPLIREDRIYEYKIVASRVPQKAAEVDYDFILESRKLLFTFNPFRSRMLSEIAMTGLGSKDFAWAIALLTRNLSYFGPDVFVKSVAEILAPNDPRQNVDVHLPTSMSDLKKIFDDSVSLFGLEETVDHMINLLGGLSEDFKESFNSSLNQISKTFSYHSFIKSARSKVPVFQLLLTISEYANNAGALSRLSQLNIDVPNKIGEESYTTIEGLSKIFTFVNSIIYVITRSQERSDTLEDILRELKTPPPQPPPQIITPVLPPFETIRPVTTIPILPGPTGPITAPFNPNPATINTTPSNVFGNTGPTLTISPTPNPTPTPSNNTPVTVGSTGLITVNRLGSGGNTSLGTGGGLLGGTRFGGGLSPR